MALDSPAAADEDGENDEGGEGDTWTAAAGPKVHVRSPVCTGRSAPEEEAEEEAEEEEEEEEEEGVAP